MSRLNQLFWFTVKLLWRRPLAIKREKAALQLALSVHCHTAGFSTKVLNWIFRRKVFAGAKDDLLLAGDLDPAKSTGPATHEIANEIRSDGYSIASVKLEKDVVRSILKIESKLIGNLTLANGKSLECVSLADAEQTTDPLRLNYDPAGLIHHEVISEIMRSKLLSDVAQDYLKGAYLDSVNMWRSFACEGVETQGLSEAAQLYHFDYERLSWLKVFVYLTDVDEQSGPHVYVPQSHRPALKKFGLLREGYERVSDQQVEDAYGKRIHKQICGPSGTVFFGDTLAFHKGTPPKTGHRVVLELQYANNEFGYCPTQVPEAMRY